MSDLHAQDYPAPAFNLPAVQQIITSVPLQSDHSLFHLRGSCTRFRSAGCVGDKLLLPSFDMFRPRVGTNLRNKWVKPVETSVRACVSQLCSRMAPIHFHMTQRAALTAAGSHYLSCRSLHKCCFQLLSEGPDVRGGQWGLCERHGGLECLWGASWRPWASGFWKTLLGWSIVTSADVMSLPGWGGCNELRAIQNINLIICI